MRSRRNHPVGESRLTLAIVLAFALSHCTERFQDAIGTLAAGEACGQISECRAGLDCVDGICTVITSTLPPVRRGDCCDAALFALADPEGQCGEVKDCGVAGLVCGTQGVCSGFAGGTLGDPCGLAVDCKQSPIKMVCHGNDGICVDPLNPNPDCQPPATVDCDHYGAKDLGETCLELTECQRPYVCSPASQKCEPLPFYPGPDCLRTETEEGLFRAYYEIPAGLSGAGSSALGANCLADADCQSGLGCTDGICRAIEFYRLPFPNDIRLVGGRVDLAGHPSPGDVFGLAVAGNMFTAIEQDADGFAINSAVFFRFTDPLALESICLPPGSAYSDPLPLADGTDPGTYCPGHGSTTPPAATVYLVNIDPDSAAYNTVLPVQMSFGRDRGQYNCQNLLAVGPLDGKPLAHNTTYAAIVTTGVRDIRGDGPIHDADFAGILAADSNLSQPVLSATQPLRDWLQDQGIAAATLAAATVFTTGNPDAISPDLRDAVHALSAPQFDAGAFKCEPCAGLAEGVCQDRPDCAWTGSACTIGTYPCHQMPLLDPVHPPRGCVEPAAGFWDDVDEVHGTFQAPVFQIGTRPYDTAPDGGALDLSAPQAVAETMCFAMAVKKGAPADEKPVMIYAHGTGGNFRSFIASEPDFVKMLVDLGFIVIGFDNVLHGARQDPERDPGAWTPENWRDPSNLFFNVANARAARDNVLQGAIDLFHLTRLLVAEDNTPALAVPGVELQIDEAQIFFFGQSQGTTIAFPYLVEETSLRAAVLSGAGADLALSILHKKAPIDAAEVTGMLLADRSLSRLHPMMGIMAQVFGPSDAIAYAPHLLSGRPQSDPLGAGRGPLPLLLTYGIGDSFSPDPTQDALVATMGVPLVAADQTHDGHGYVVLDPAVVGAVDGHFVAFSEEGRKIVRHFLATGLAGNPEVRRTVP